MESLLTNSILHLTNCNLMQLKLFIAVCRGRRAIVALLQVFEVDAAIVVRNISSVHMDT